MITPVHSRSITWAKHMAKWRYQKLWRKCISAHWRGSRKIIVIWHRNKVTGYKMTSVIVNLSYSGKRAIPRKFSSNIPYAITSSTAFEVNKNS